MEAKIGIYDSHRLALEAIELLTKKGFPENRLKLIGQADIVDDNIKIKSNEPMKNIALLVGIIFGIVMGMLSGMRYFYLPLAEFVYGTGPLIGALIGVDLGLVAGGAVSLLITLLVKTDKIVLYHEHLKEGKFLVFADGTAEEIKKAKIVLCRCGTNLELCFN
jgi:hypothetical protein